jgi:hypothetical protein
MGKYGKGLHANILRNFLSNGYKKDQAKSLDGYQRDDSLSGQRAQVYYNKDNNKTIVTHRGTQGFQDVLTDLKLAFHPSLYMKSNRFQYAKDIQQRAEDKYGRENITTIGHSLGAKLAADVGGKSKEMITYNKPIIPQEIFKQTRKNETSIRTKMDPVSILGSFNPNIKQVSTKTINPITAHNTAQLGELKNEFVGAGESDGLKKVLSNFDLFRIAEEKRIPLNDVIAKDEIKKLKKDGNYIINLENHNQGGSHWTALILGKKNCLYCDSFGMPPPELLYLFLEKKYKKVDFSRKEIQDMDSTLCGYFCLEFFKFMRDHPNGTLVNNLNQYQNLYSENTKENDDILTRLFLS